MADPVVAAGVDEGAVHAGVPGVGVEAGGEVALVPDVVVASVVEGFYG